jgi:hypothetical protein
MHSASIVLAALALAACDASQESHPGAGGTSRPAGAESAGVPFDCTPIKMWDGDGPIWCAEGPKIGLAGIAVREIEMRNAILSDVECRVGRPCPAPSGLEAQGYLAGLLSADRVRSARATEASGHILIKGPTLSCVSNVAAGGSKAGAWCVSPVVGDLSWRW